MTAAEVAVCHMRDEETLQLAVTLFLDEYSPRLGLVSFKLLLEVPSQTFLGLSSELQGWGIIIATASLNPLWMSLIPFLFSHLCIP